MRISAEWLEEYVALPPADELGHVFEMAGIGVENQDGGNWTLEITSNRGDWLSAIGLAREIGAMTETTAHLPSFSLDSNATAPTEVEIESPDDCARYVLREITGVEIGPSPDWLQQRLIACGQRPVNNVVDITNYVMLETGQPLHAFDADTLQGNIRVRRATDGETLTTLDGQERTLSPEVMLICDASGPIAVAGIMGGEHTEVTESTKRIWLESAHFSPTRVRRGVRAIGLTSEASRRFERWVNPNGARHAADRAAQLLQELAGGQVADWVGDFYPRPVEDVRLALRTSRCNAILGLQLSTETIASALTRLGLRIENQADGLLQVAVPTWRRDIEREVDLIEEVARMHGYDKIPTTLPGGVNPEAGLSLSQRLRERAKEALLRCGLNETVTYSLESAADVARAGLDATAPTVQLRNPLSDDYAQLRTSLIPSLLKALRNNARRPAQLFEISKVYLPRQDDPHGQPDERLTVGIALLDAPAAPHWQKATGGVDFFALKAIVETLLHDLGTQKGQFVAVRHPALHPGRGAQLLLNGQEIGVLGEVHPDVAEAWDLGGRAYIAQFDFEALIRHVSLVKKHVETSRFPSADRDLALVVENRITAGELESSLRAAGGPLLESLTLFDIYTGPPVPEGHKSLALALRFRSIERTLREDEVEAAVQNIRATAERDLGAKLR